jgi:hypothetical protein
MSTIIGLPKTASCRAPFQEEGYDHQDQLVLSVTCGYAVLTLRAVLRGAFCFPEPGREARHITDGMGLD